MVSMKKDGHGRVLVHVALCVMAFAAVGSSMGQQAIETATTTAYSYAAGSVEAGQVLQWLDAHPGFRGERMAQDIAALGGAPAGKLTVVVAVPATRVSPDAPAMAAGDGPRAPLPATGVPGQRITITLDTGARMETWAYQWMAHSSGRHWVLTDYEDHRPVDSSPHR